jgi:hypothetical protein
MLRFGAVWVCVLICEGELVPRRQLESHVGPQERQDADGELPAGRQRDQAREQCESR